MSFLTKAWSLIKFIVGIERKVEPIIEEVKDKVDRDEATVPVSVSLIKDKERQINQATSWADRVSAMYDAQVKQVKVKK